ncbi:Phytochrome, two-component sensor histidine kinase [Candidatus Phaeomarinobacter ectocarpi]|uniref:Phytochrome, two-component sensor histidine kinase n=1 Tax=Candidatus Phaeomarinibacter ectocarpi TaxID=1458461 RepID=X5MNC8_9HYPH|nr:response regulator [Candidatus Phaeomarinobacter ectocarpi]CDO60001.1 Phytochrome, two-component sensor histidine kinase [Candidatus Phaeomarinobacter ectocarpi]
MRVLIVEDMAIIALDIDDMIQSVTPASVQIASTVDEAAKALDAGVFDFVVLDYSVGDDTTADIARRLKADGVHCVVISGYGRNALKHNEMQGLRILDKPIRKDLLSAEIHFALTRRSMRQAR